MNTVNESSSSYVAESIFHRLVAKYPKWLKPEITDVRIGQTQELVWLEITEEHEPENDGCLLDQTIKRSDLAFCIGVDYEDCYFSRNDSVSDNATKFVETWDPFAIINTTDLFHHEAFVEIASNENSDPDDQEF